MLIPAETPPPNWSIEFYVDTRGRSPVVEFLATMSKLERVEARNAIRLLQEFGTTLGIPHARSMTGHGKLWELRAGPNRFLYFACVGRRFVILHAFRKKSQKTPIREIATAERRMADFLERQHDS